MERMKRLISGFLALVLVLGMVPGVPMVAGAEELETVAAETVAVETTQPEVIPEETAAPETAAPVETEPAQTVPQETAPAATEAEETVPAQTVPEETAAETAPAETIPEETVTEEAIEKLEASAEAANAYEEIQPVDEVKVVASKERTYLNDRVKLTAVITPENVLDPSVTWVVDGAEIVEVLEDGVLISSDAPGVVEIYAVSNDIPEEEDAEPVRSESVYVTFLEYWMEINLLPLAEENRFDEEDERYNTHCRVKSGESVEISAKYLTRLLEEDQTGQDRDFIVESLSDPDIQWSMTRIDENGDELDDAGQYAALKVSEKDPTVVTLRAKTVTQTYTVKLTAKDRIAGEHSVYVVIYPEPYKVVVEMGELPEGMVRSADGTAITVNLNRFTDFTQYLELSAKVYPLEADQELTWKCSDKIISLEDADEDEETTDRMKLYVDNYEGTSTVTVTSVENPDISVSITIKRKRLMDKERLSISLASSKVTEMVTGETETFTAIDIQDREILTDDVVEWSLPNEEDHPYASITKAGKLTVKNIAVGKVITLRCAIIGYAEEEEAWIEWPLTVRPKATKVEILPGTIPSEQYAEDLVCNGKTLYINTVNDVKPFELGFRVYPEDGDAPGAKQEVKWKSSNSAIASVDPDTDEIVWEGKNGTVTITATATDGSGKKATVKLKFCEQAESIQVILPGIDYVRSGSSLTLDVELTPEKINSKTTRSDVTWSLECEQCGTKGTCAKISSAGKVTAKTVYKNHTLTVYATTKDGADLTASAQITVKPKKDGILIIKEDGDYLTKITKMVDVGDSITLEAYSLYDTEEEAEYVTWKSSNSKIADVDEDGNVTVLKVGTATITATAGDGRKATMTVKGVRMADAVEITQKNDQQELASGKSMTLKATPVDDEGKAATVKKVVWSLDDGDKAYATLSASGKLTAVKNYVGEPVTITVKATTTDGTGLTGEYSVTICPIAQGVRIDLDDFERTRTSCIYGLKETPQTLELSAAVYPETAKQDVTWKSSNKAIAAVDRDTGELTVKKAGTVTITATAADGSGKKASFKLKIVKLVNDITFSNVNFLEDGSMVIAEGRSVTLKPTLWDYNGKKVTGRKLAWSISDTNGNEDFDPSYIKISQKGVLTTKAVSEPKSVTVTVKTVEETEGLEVYQESFTVYVYPKTTSVKIWYNGSEDFTRVYVQKGETLDLDALSYSTGSTTNAAQAWTWKSSNKKVATVDENGVVTGLKAGTVTITVTAKDGTGKKDTIKVTVRP